MTLSQIARFILESKKIGITYHVSPDGDAVGSVLALFNALKSLNKDKLITEAYKFASKSIEIPTKFSELVDSLTKGRAKLQFEMKGLDKPLTDLNRMVNRVAFSLIVGCMIIGSSLIVNAKTGPTFQGVPILGLIGFIVSGIFGLWLLISIIKSGFF